MDWGIVLGIIGVVGIPMALIGVGISLAVGASPTRGEFNAARMCFIASALIIAVGVFLTLWNYPEGSPVVRVIVTALIGAIVFGGLAASLNWVNHKENPPKQGPDAPIEGSVFVEVQNLTPLPEVYPADGRIEVLFLSSEEQFLNGEATGTRRVVTSVMTGIPGSKINWPKPKKPSQFGTPAARIEITNDIVGGGTLFDLTLPIRAGIGMAPNNKTIESNLILIRLDSGASNRRSLYVANGFGETIGVTFGYFAFAHRSDETVMRPIRVGGSLSNPVSQAVILFVFPDFPENIAPSPSIKPETAGPNSSPKKD